MFLIPKNFYEIRKTKNKGRGVFAKKRIARGTVIGDYLGIIKNTKDVSETNGLYEMELTENISILPDKNGVGIQLINHSCNPNCSMYIYNHHILYYATKNISPGEEITVDYLMGSSKDEDVCNHKCFCGSSDCRGTMHDETDSAEEIWQKLTNENNSKATQPLKYKLNEPYPGLSVYPKKIDIIM